MGAASDDSCRRSTNTTARACGRDGASCSNFDGLTDVNLFNLTILGFDDIIYSKGPILAHISATNLLPALSAILMSVIAILTLFYQPKTSRMLRITWLGVVIFAIYALNTYGVFYLETR